MKKRKLGPNTLHFSGESIEVDTATGKGVQRVINMFQSQIEYKVSTFKRESCYQAQDTVLELIEELWGAMGDYSREQYGTLFTTYAWTCINNKIRTMIKASQNQRNQQTVFIEDITSSGENGINIDAIEFDIYGCRKGDNTMEDSAHAESLRGFLSSSISKQRRSKMVKKKILVTLLLLESGYNQKEISLMLGYCHERINMYIQELRVLVKKFNEMHVRVPELRLEVLEQQLQSLSSDGENTLSDKETRVIQTIYNLLNSEYIIEDVVRMLGLSKTELQTYFTAMNRSVGEVCAAN